MQIIYGKCFVNHSFRGFAQNWICVFLRIESTVLIRSGYSFVAVEVKVWKYNKTLNVRFLGKPVSFVFPRVVLFPSTSCRDTSNMVTERVCSKLKTCWKSVVFTNKVGNILGDPGADSGGEGESKRGGKYGTKKSKERRAVLYFSSCHIFPPV